MRIHCPFCGERDSSEFSVSGDAGCRRPNCDAPNSDAAGSDALDSNVPDSNAPDSQMCFFEAVYLRPNPAGRHSELWYHGFGCRSWLEVTRDTRTHEIFAVELAQKDAG